MSRLDALPPTCESGGPSSIQQRITPRAKDLGGFTVRRLLPAAQHKRVGPFIFFDHMGPVTLPAGSVMDVRPHPHIGLSTLTYLFEGRIVHRDSLGSVQVIEPGAVNWMTAGRGIVHSERSPDDERAAGARLHGLQIWIALPDGDEEIEPSFTHHPARSLPRIERAGTRFTLVAGAALGERSPVPTRSPLFYLDADAAAGADMALPDDAPERAAYVVTGEVEVDGARIEPGHMVVFAAGASPAIKALSPSRVMLLGGAPLASDRTVWWNFAASTKARIEAAKERWRSGGFDRVPGETEFIPLP